MTAYTPAHRHGSLPALCWCDMIPQPDEPAPMAGQDAPDTVRVRGTAPDMADTFAAYRSALRFASLRIAEAALAPGAGLVAPVAPRRDPWALRAADRLFRMQPIRFVRRHTKFWHDLRVWGLGVDVDPSGVLVSVLCFRVAIYWGEW